MRASAPDAPACTAPSTSTAWRRMSSTSCTARSHAKMADATGPRGSEGCYLPAMGGRRQRLSRSTRAGGPSSRRHRSRGCRIARSDPARDDPCRHGRRRSPISNGRRDMRTTPGSTCSRCTSHTGICSGTFISPLTNERDDEYGGSLENRMRFPLEVFDACRTALAGAQADVSAHFRCRLGARGAWGRKTRSKSLAWYDRRSRVRYRGRERGPDGRLSATPVREAVPDAVLRPHPSGGWTLHTMAVGNISSYMDVNAILAAGERRPVSAGACASVGALLDTTCGLCGWGTASVARLRT